MDEFKTLNPTKLELYAKGFQMRQEERDNEMWMWFGNYGISALVYAMDHVLNGSNKAKSKYAEKPILLSHKLNKSNQEEKLRQQRELFWASLLTMEKNWKLSHPEKDEANT